MKFPEARLAISESDEFPISEMSAGFPTNETARDMFLRLERKEE